MKSAKWTDLGILFLRVLTGAGMVYHGYPKVFGGMMPRMIEGVAAMGFPMPALFAWAAALSEFVGGILLVLGFGARYAAFFIFCTMSVAFFVTHRADAFQVKELALVYWVISVALILTGAGKYSLDGVVRKAD